MFIKSLTLNGFKAFAEKTTLKFEEGICGLLGPNGSGKSNIMDAIKWVVGEQKASELRGDKMEDVIFHGSESGKTCNMAEVEIVVANENSILPLEYNEISITRRLYRSGESEYLINKKPSRLKDIQLLFMDTGVGKSTYSVIEQGKIDKILSKNPEDRRYIFEEAAGISRYRDRKKEYERKIAKTKENLQRVTDIIVELEKQHTQLKRQAEKSSKYFDLQEHLKVAEVDLLLYRLIQTKSNKAKQEEAIYSLSKEQADLVKDLEQQKEKIETLRKSIMHDEKNISSSEKKKIEIDEKINSFRSQNVVLSERYEEVKQNLIQRQDEVKNFEKEKKDLADKIAELGDEVKAKQALREKHDQELSDFKEKIKSLEEKEKSYREEVVKFKLRLDEIKVERENLNKEHFIVVEKLLAEIDEQKERLSKEKTEQARNREEIKKELEEVSTAFEKMVPYQTEEALQAGLNELNRLSVNEVKEDFKQMLIASFTLQKKTSGLKERFKQLLKSDDPFYQIIFSTEGTYSQKEKIDQEISNLQSESDLCEKKIAQFEKDILNCQSAVTEAKQKSADIEITKAALIQTIDMNIRIREEKIANTNSLETRFQSAKQAVARQETIIQEIENKKKEVLKDAGKLEKETLSIAKHLTQFSESIQAQTSKLYKQQDKFQNAESRLEKLKLKTDEMNFNLRLVDRDIEVIYEKAMNDFSQNLRVLEENIHNKEFNSEKSKKTIDRLREELRSLGGNVNPLAQDEFNSLDERLNEMKKQSADIESSMDDLVRVVQEIDENSREVFLQTFNTIKKNFHIVFRRLFDGGTGKIELLDEDNPLISGIEVFIQPPGKKFQSINLFSGGEKSLIAIALMFSIFLVKPSPICLLDEVDSALDKHNLVRLAKLLDEFKNRTQIMIITHNDKTASIIDYVYGISMNNGISKTISLALPKK